MEPLLWHWSAFVQVSSALVIAGYFVVLARSLRRPELHAWVIAWWANLAALLITIAFWRLPSPSPTVFAIITSCYFFAKTQFVVLLVAGVTGFALDQPRPVRHGRFSTAIAVFSALCGIVVGSLDRVGLVQSVMTGAVLYAGAIWVARKKTPAWHWLATGFVLRALFAAAETSVYAFRAMRADAPVPEWLASFMASHSAFDAGAEWLIALGCVLTLHGRIRQEATESKA